MSYQITGTATTAPALRERTAAGHTDRDRRLEPSRIWTMLEALAYAGAFIDPTGALVVERLRRAKEAEEERHARH